jgi:hypothetical protein
MYAKTVLTGLLAAAMTAICPAVAAAAIAPALTLDQSAGTVGGTSPPLALHLNFNVKTFDTVKDLTLAFPPGFLLNLGAEGGACVASGAPSALCRLGGGTINGASGTPVSFYLVAPPKFPDIAGVALVEEGGATTVGDVTMSSSPGAGVTVSFQNITKGMTELDFTLSAPRLPTNCSVARNINVQATSWQGGSGSAAAPLAVTGCNGLPYGPSLSATVTKQPGSSGALVVVTLAQNPGESATSGLEFGTPGGVKINKILAPCFHGSPCTVGSVSASSPLLPSSTLSTGQLSLAGAINPGSLNAPITGSMTMSFPPPYPLSIAGPINLTQHTITFLGLPDIPLSTMVFTFTGTPAGPAFVTSCEPGTISATVTPQSGNPPIHVTGPVTELGCPPPTARPNVSGSFSGLANGRPRLQVRASRAAGAPAFASLSIALPGGLSFSRATVACRARAGRSCKRSGTIRGLSVAGAHIKSARMQGTQLQLTFSQPVASVSLVAKGPLLLESKGLQRKAKRHRTGHLSAHVRLTYAGGGAAATNVP